MTHLNASLHTFRKIPTQNPRAREENIKTLQPNHLNDLTLAVNSYSAMSH